MDRELFSSLLRDVLANIRDYEVLERHALNEIVPRTDPAMDKAGNLRIFIWEGIKALKPVDEIGAVDMLKWRYYNILSGRYIQGLSTSELQRNLSLGARQERRMHIRAVNTLEEILWDRLHLGKKTKEVFEEELAAIPGADTKFTRAAPNSEDDFSFSVTLEPLQFEKIIAETATLFLQQFHARGGEISVQVPAHLPIIMSDRIILRQILLYLFNQIMRYWAGGPVSINAHPIANLVIMEIIAWVDEARSPREEMLQANPLFTYWMERLNVHLLIDTLEPDQPSPGPNQTTLTAFTLELPLANQSKLLVVDDHEQAIRIIELYLNETNIQVVGISDPTQVLPAAQMLQPEVVLLDVMMPGMDGWEILQNLKSDPETHQIPVIVCSVWDQPDLANILGADAFIKKPIHQSELLKELAHLHLLDTPDA